MMKKSRTTLDKQPVDVHRRESLLSMGRLGVGALGVAAIGGSVALGVTPTKANATGVCVMTPEGRSGPFYLNLNSVRADVRESAPGKRLDLCFTVIDAVTCDPHQNAVVEIWSCDATGHYSGYHTIDPDVPGYTQVPLGQVPPEAPHYPPSDNDTFLRGVQLTNAAGIVRFTTVYPSWYATRTPHVHVKVYLQLPTTDQTAIFTTQMYFDEATNAAVLGTQLYQGRTAARDTMNDTDRHFVAMGGSQDILDIQNTTFGYEGSHILSINFS